VDQSTHWVVLVSAYHSTSLHFIMNLKKATLTLLASLGLAATPTLAQTIFNDTFDVGEGTIANDAGDPSDILWTRRQGGTGTGTPAVSVDTGGAFAGTGKSVDHNITGSTTTAFYDFYARFAEQTLAINESITFTFSLRLYSTPAIPNRPDQFRIVLSNTTSSGTTWSNGDSGSSYGFSLGTGPGTGATSVSQLTFRSTSSVPSGASANTSLGAHAPVYINDTNAHTVTFSVTRVSAIENLVSFKLDDQPAVAFTTTLGITPVTGGAPLTTFDHVGIMITTSPFRYRLDNLSVVRSALTPGDADGDSLDDVWESLNFGNTSAQDGAGDPDGDGYNNEAEETATSNPNNILSTPIDLDADGLLDTWEVTNFGAITAQNGSGDPDRDLVSNALEFAASTNPNDNTSWPDADTDTLNDAWEVLYFGSIAHPDAIPGANPDGDGFTNKQENDALSNPTVAISVPGDFDGDNLADAWEISNFGNITNHTGIGDPDGDRATNEQEETAGSNPNNNASWPDTDFDFLNDAWEVFYFGNITLHDYLSDPDGDTFNNDIEHTFGFDPTDPLSSPDLDGDGVADGWEVALFGSVGVHDGLADPDSDGFNNIFESGFRTNPSDGNSQPGDLNGDGISDGIILKPGGDPLPLSSFVPVGTTPPAPGWWDGLYPSAGKTYIVDGTGRGGLRSPNLTGSAYTFAGDRLVLLRNASLIWKHNGSLTFALLQSNGGVLNQAIGGTNTVGTLNGTLELLGTNPTTISAVNGAFVSNAAISGPAGLTISGSNLVTLNGAMTFTGNITVAAGYPNPATNRLTLGSASNLTFTLGNSGATNTITGAGAITLNGAFTINSTAVTTTTPGSSWALLTNTSTRTYGATFSVAGYFPDAGTVGSRKWTTVLAPFYQFDEATGLLTIVSAVDSDSDGLNDAYELSVFGDLSQTPTSDFDGDLVTNLAEFIAGTNPASSTSWPDTDSDGVNDAWELLTFGNLTTATATDMDGDTLLDTWEVARFGSIAAQTAGGDPDIDGFTNAQEFAAGSNPTVSASVPADTDGNGILDVNEQVAPYAVDADTLHLWRLDDIAPPFANAASPSHPLRGLLNGATNLRASIGGFGSSVNTNAGTTPNFGIVSYAATLVDSTNGDTASPASPAFVWQGATGTFTLEAVIKLDSLPSTWGSTGQIISMDGEGTEAQDRVFQFRINPTGSTLQFVRLNGTIQTLSVNLPLTGVHGLDTTSWFHVAVTYDGNVDTDNNIKFYWTKIIPGVTAANLLGGARMTASFPAVVHGDLAIGNEARNAGGSSEHLRGSIDEVRISAVARAATGFLFKSVSTFAAPTSLTATPGTNSVALSWTGSVGASTYTIKRSTVAGGPYTDISSGTVTGTTYTDTTAVSGNTYYYVVSAVGAIESANSNEATASVGSLYQSWATANSLTSGLNDGPTQDPENDGLVNLLEYALGGTNPLLASVSTVTTSIVTNGLSQQVIRLSFPRVNDPAISYVVQASDTLTGGFVDVVTYPAAATPVQHDDTVPLTTGTRRFLRVDVRQN
jgi:hypothetical protein